MHYIHKGLQHVLLWNVGLGHISMFCFVHCHRNEVMLSLF
jgi:hypothetical protein